MLKNNSAATVTAQVQMPSRAQQFAGLRSTSHSVHSVQSRPYLMTINFLPPLVIDFLQRPICSQAKQHSIPKQDRNTRPHHILVPIKPFS
jgi:hypothetical protein